MKKIKISNISLFLPLVFTFSGCLNTQKYTPPVFTPKVYKNTKDNEAIKVILNKVGGNNITGNALLKQQGGGIVTCAGNEVALFPKTNYSTEYVQDMFSENQYLYGYFTNGKGYKQSTNWVMNPYSDSKTTICDSQGNFEFQNLADGTYYVVTVVSWSIPSRYGSDSQGGNLIQEIELKNNSTKRIILSK